MSTKLKYMVSLVGVVVLTVLMIMNMGASAACQPTNQGMRVMDIKSISLLNDVGKIVEIQVHIANDDLERSQGYQHICENIIDNTAILFVYSQPIGGRFHMNNVKAALDIGFFDDHGRLIDTMVMKTYDGGNKRLYSPDQAFQYALEARAGFFEDHQLSATKARLVVHSINDSM